MASRAPAEGLACDHQTMIIIQPASQTEGLAKLSTDDSPTTSLIPLCQPSGQSTKRHGQAGASWHRLASLLVV